MWHRAPNRYLVTQRSCFGGFEMFGCLLLFLASESSFDVLGFRFCRGLQRRIGILGENQSKHNIFCEIQCFRGLRSMLQRAA